MATGDYVVRRNNAVTTTIPNAGSDLLLDWDTAVANVGSGITHSSGTFTLGETGHFLVMCSEHYRASATTNNERINCKMTLNLAGTELVEGYSVGYIRKSSFGSHDYINFSAAIINVTTTTGNGDDLQVRVERIDNTTAGGQEPDRVANDRSGITIIKLDDSWGYGRYQSSSVTATSGTDNTRTVMNIQTQDEEDSPFTRTTNNVDIATGNLVLAVYSVKSEDSAPAGRSEFQSNLFLNGSVVEGSWNQQYIRTTDNSDWGGSSNVCLLDPTSGWDLNVGVVSREGGGEDFSAAVQLVELPAGAEAIILNSAAGDINAAATNFNWPNASVYEDSAAFTFSSGQTNIDVDNAGDYIVMASMGISTDAGTGGNQRPHPALQFRVNTTDIEHAGNATYNRGNGTADHSSLACATLLDGLSANDSIHCRIDRLNSSQTTAITNSSGQFAVIRLSSLFDASHVALPGVGTLTTTGFAPTVERSWTVSPGTGSISTSGSIPVAKIGTTIAVPLGTLTAAGYAPPTVNQPSSYGLQLVGYVPLATTTGDANHTAEPDTGTLVLDGKIASLAMDHVIGVPAGSLTTSGAAASVERSWTVNPGVGSISATGSIATLARHHVIGVPAGSLSTSGAIPDATTTLNHVIAVGAGSLSTAGEIPTLDHTLNHVIVVPTGTLTLTGLAPGVAVTITVAPAAATLVLVGEIPTLDHTQNHIRAPPAGTLTATGLAPTAERSWTVAPGTGTLVLDGKIPVVQAGEDHIVQPPTGTLSITGAIPTLSYSWTLSPDAGALVLDGKIPTVAVTENHVIPVPAGSLIVTSAAPSTERSWVVEPGAGSISAAGYVPDVSYSWVISPDTGTMVLTGAIPTAPLGDNHIAQPGTGTLTLTGHIPTTERSWTVTPGVGSISASGYVPGVAVGITVAPPVGTLTATGYAPPTVLQPSSYGLQLVGYAPTILIEGSSQPGAGTLTLTGYAPTIVNTGDPKVIPVGTGTLTISGESPALEITIIPPTPGLVLTGYIPTIVWTDNHVIEVPAGSLTLSGSAPTVQSEDHTAEPGAGSLTVTGYAPSLERSWTIDVPVGNLTAAGYAPDLEFNFIVAPGTGTLVLDGKVPTATTTENHVIAVPAGSLMVSGAVPTASRTENHTIPVGAGTLTLEGKIPTLLVDGPHTIEVPVGSLVLSSDAATVINTTEVDVEEPPSGGWGALNAYDRYRQKRHKRRKKRKKTLEEIAKLQGTEREIARLLHKQLEYEARDREISELEDLVNSRDVNTEAKALGEINANLAKTFTRAYMQGNFSAIEAFEREMERAADEEELLLLAMVLLR